MKFSLALFLIAFLASFPYLFLAKIIEETSPPQLSALILIFRKVQVMGEMSSNLDSYPLNLIQSTLFLFWLINQGCRDVISCCHSSLS